MGKFGFVIHPFDTRDVARKYPLVDRFSSEWVESFLKHAPPINAQHMQNIRVRGAEAEGWLVATTLTSRQLLDLPVPFVLRKIIAACKKAERQGAQIIGLGALTSVVGDAGISVARQLSIPVTTGNSYTVATAIQATCQAAGLMGIDLGRANLCVVGATGAIGAVCARMMAASVGRLILTARNEEKLEGLAGLIFSESAVLADIQPDLREAVREADIVLAVSSAAEELIHPEDLKPGAVVCDVARPRDVSRRVAAERDDVLVIEGGLVEVPGGWEGKPFSFGLPHGIVYACMAETMLLALEGRYECFTLGRSIGVEQVREIDALARKHGFQLAAFRSFERLLSPEQIGGIRQRADLKRKKKILAP
ncbi:putative amino acid dehydrogenase [Tumebacillus sp. BK434]|uniref:shikimate dehydrogenase n=1 Tax=Tumebacillus sp. BK434 TaxID=2512169 RepID=UPI0010506CC7|nr:shikimate dehydrogenase [Tumebacillus sp. BK434]TCP54727.1 putative amino acid dehydrogenase [Tumebacillus sp. BK434]